MDIRETKQGEFLILEPVGRLDTKTSHELEKKVLEHVTAGQRRFIVDMASLEYLSSAGLRVLLMLAKKLGGTDGGHLALCSMNTHVKEVFDIAGFASIFTICATPAAAIASAPTGTKSDRAVEMAVKTLGVSKEDTHSRARPDAPPSDLVARAARLLGVKDV